MTVNIGNKCTMNAVGKGTIKFEAAVNGKWLHSHMDNVLYVPTARRNLLSVASAVDKGLQCIIEKTECRFIRDGVVKACGIRVGKLFKMNIRLIDPEKSCQREANVAIRHTLQIWHERFGHQNKRHVQSFLRQRGIAVEMDNEFCGACVEGKQHRDSFRSRQQRSSRPGEIMHADLCGPMECASLGGARYFVCFTCDYSRLRMVFLLREKSETAGKIADMLEIIKTHRGRPPKIFQCDGGREFINKDVRDLMSANGIKLVVSNPHTPEQNGCAERTNRTVVELSRTMLLARNLPKMLWAEAVNTSVYILNRTGTSGVDDKSPYELFYGKTEHLERLRIFGTMCYVHVPDAKRRKWDAKGRRGIFVGYSDEMDGYRVWIKSENRVVRSRNVVFEPEISGRLMTLFPLEAEEDNYTEEVQVIPGSGSEEVPEAEFVPDVEEPAADCPSDVPVELPEPERQLRDRAGIRPPRRYYEAMLAEVEEPTSYEGAIKSQHRKQWLNAMEEEIRILEKTSTWSLVDLPPGRKAVSNRWVYRVKRNADGRINRFKSRLVARGYSQKRGIDYGETFSPVARFDTIRTMLSVAANEGLELGQFDVKSAFLNGVLEEEIFMEQPEGFRDSTERVCRLHKSLYGLKQSPRCWNQRFKGVLVKFGLEESDADSCLFYRGACADKLMVAIYVDDGLIAATRRDDIDVFLCELGKVFEITVDSVGYFLSMHIQRRDDGSIFINQQNYAGEILRRFVRQSRDMCSRGKLRKPNFRMPHIVRRWVHLCTWLWSQGQIFRLP